jgi:ribA/ribD-fused uncharacterized protein
MTVAGARCVEDLVGLVRGGERPKYLMFWGHRPPGGGGVGRGCLSQWWPVRFTVDGLSYPSAEHFMMAGKARLFGDAGIAEQIRRAPHPGAAKALGREVAGFDEERWAEHRFGVVVAGNLAKFGQHTDLREFLMATAAGCWSRRLPRTRPGASGWPRTTSGPRRQRAGWGTTCSASRSWRCASALRPAHSQPRHPSPAARNAAIADVSMRQVISHKNAGSSALRTTATRFVLFIDPFSAVCEHRVRVPTRRSAVPVGLLAVRAVPERSFVAPTAR